MDFDERIIKKSDMKYIDKVTNLLADQKSKNIYLGVVSRRNNKVFDYSHLKDDKVQYFDKDIVKVHPNEVFVDGGAFIGDTIEKFENYCDNNYKRIYAYEADPCNYKKLVKNTQNNSKVICVNKALWSRTEQLHFCDDNSRGSHLETEGNMLIDAEALHVLEEDKVTFIKMDIEGAELDALEGMKEIIKKNKPKLAICIYHKYDDLWKIPLYINQLVPEYKLYIRHYHNILDETVLYAVI